MPLDFFSKTRLPEKLPVEMSEIIGDLKKSTSKEECLKKVYDLLSGKYQGARVQTYLKFPTIFKKDINLIWSQKGFLHCTNINYVARILLVESNFFEEKDITLRWTLIWHISPHQYLKVKVAENKFINMDIWAKNYGIEFGDYAKGFK
ncbi:MAG: hypothetical protein RBS77_02215 [Candidatus Moranbacteria bacterium]|jgi:hypothetical protein|nr:hypothetical protein [Candidatus Moranbacteria bacterium]